MITRIRSTGSTNADVRAWARAGRPHGEALVADIQTAGRGRIGREWASASGNLHLSILVRPKLSPARIPLLCLAAAVAGAEVCGDPVRIKWPNDLLAHGLKLGGILAEVESEPGLAVVVGIGINVAHAPIEGATSLSALDLDIPDLAERLTERFLELAALLERDPAPVLDRWRARADTLGKRVRIDQIDGIATDIGPDGSLQIRTESGLTRVTAGDVQMVAKGPT